MAEAGWRKENGSSAQPLPSMATYADAMSKFTNAAAAFMEHVHLLTEARDAYLTAMTAGAELRRHLDAGDQRLRSVLGQLEQVVNKQLAEPTSDKKQPGAVNAESMRANSENAATRWKFLP